MNPYCLDLHNTLFERPTLSRPMLPFQADSAYKILLRTIEENNTFKQSLLSPCLRNCCNKWNHWLWVQFLAICSTCSSKHRVWSRYRLHIRIRN